MEQISGSLGGENSGARWRWLFIIFAVSLFLIFISGLFWIFTKSTASPIGLGWFLFSFAAGLSMIVLPCTLPLAFVIVPLSMGKGYVKGLMVALAFGLGVAITLSTYGIFAALLGKAFIAYAGAGGEIIKNIFYAIAGVFAMLFALSELGLIKFRVPSYMGAAPAFIQKRSDIAKALMLGLFLGNIGIGCPHPATPIILGQIGITGDVFYGWLLFLTHAIGRIIPLLLLAILGILGVNATKALMARKESIAKATAWGMVFVGAFLFTLGFFSHDWWVFSGMHTLLEEITQEERFLGILKGRWESTVTHVHDMPTGTGFFGLPLWLGNWVFVFLMALPLWGSWLLERRKSKSLAELEQDALKKKLKLKGFKFAVLTIIFILTFIYVLPQRFLTQQLAHQAEEAEHMAGTYLPAQTVDVSEISKRADDLPGPIVRRENEKVIIELETREIVAEIMPGVTYEYWTYNGTVPGPFIRVKEGDTVEVRLTHALHSHAGIKHSFDVSFLPVKIASAHGDVEAEPRSERSSATGDAHNMNMMASEHEAAGHAKHSIDLHAVEGPGGGAVLTQTESGKTNVFQFKATRPGIYVYHCASPHIPTHVANGMYGMILVEPKNGLSKVDKEFYVMQGEFYTTGEFGEKGHQEFSLEKLKKEAPEYFVFNGRVGSLSGNRALKAKVGETIRLYFGVGSHIASNFHIIGGILDKIYPEGDIISPPRRNVQTTIVPPGGAAMIEFKLEVPGKYLLVDHSLSRAIDKGAVGEIIVEGEENPEIFKKVE